MGDLSKESVAEAIKAQQAASAPASGGSMLDKLKASKETVAAIGEVVQKFEGCDKLSSTDVATLKQHQQMNFVQQYGMGSINSAAKGIEQQCKVEIAGMKP